MKKLRYFSLFFILLLFFCKISASAAPILPYSIQVNRAWNTVTVYTHDENGAYTIPVKAMICSTARPGYVTPLGDFRLTAYRTQWQLMVDGTYGQYATQFKGNYLFHSICYEDDRHDAMVRESYNNLGNAASMGCVRLETADAKWIFDNCPAGTPVSIFDDYDSPGPLGRPDKTISHISPEGHNGWDPTDPAEDNPWQDAEITSLELSEEALTLTAGETAAITAAYEPVIANICWQSSDPAVAAVDEHGSITALAAGETIITAAGHRGIQAQCTVTVKGELLPYKDLIPGAWYYPELREVLEQGIFRGLGKKTFAPNESTTRAMVVQALHKLAGSPTVYTKSKFSDVSTGDWYAKAVNWAVQKKVVKGVSKAEFAPNVPMTRQDLAAVLWRYAGSPETDADLSAFSDGDQVASYAKTALAWMTEQGLLQGSNGYLQPEKTASRVETAVILLRFGKK